ncbi:UNVERIFIED_CONTAM: flavodoxin-like protein [Acetivibrio alkalicellulosi]
MKGLICYYSNTGNTELACRYIARSIKTVQFDFYNVADGGVPDMEHYQIVGFAAYTFWWGLPDVFQEFLNCIHKQNNKCAFIFNTYSHLSGGTQKLLYDKVSDKGFRVISAHSLRMPTSYPPKIAKGRDFLNSPNFKDFWRFNRFISRLDSYMGKISRNTNVDKIYIRNGILSLILSKYLRTKFKDSMGKKEVDIKLCDKCSICIDICPNNAISLKKKPTFDQSKCKGCWSCFNHCPKKAIYTEKIRGAGQYKGPCQQLTIKLK